MKMVIRNEKEEAVHLIYEVRTLEVDGIPVNVHVGDPT